MNKKIETNDELTPREITRRKFLKATGVALGIGAGYFIIDGIESVSNKGRIRNFLERILEERNNTSFKELQKYKVGEKQYIANSYDNYSRIINQEVEKHSFLKNFDGSDLREFYRSLNKDKDMQKGSKYTLPVWKEN